MAEPAKSRRLQSMLQAVVQSVQWTYSLFWQLCPKQGILEWGDGYYNGEIKTRKTVQSVEVSTEEAKLQRSKQLLELYDFLSTGEAGRQLRRPSTALCPEDLTESEWFYLLCMSFTFPPAVGLPGKAYVAREHVWLTRANEVDSKVFSRAILAKSARIETVVCVPLLNGVVELGTTERIEEDIGVIQHVKSFFSDDSDNSKYPPSRPVLSEHSTSNPMHAFMTHSTLNTGAAEEDEKEDKEGHKVESGNHSDAETGRLGSRSHGGTTPAAGKLMQLDMSEDIQLAGSSPDGDGSSNYLNSDLRHCHQKDLSFDDVMTREDTHYWHTVSVVLQTQSNRCPTSSATMPSADSAFSKWSFYFSSSGHWQRNHLWSSQAALKYILFNVPLFQSKSRDPTAISTPPDELGANHVLAERRRREKLNERFVTLRSLVPFVTKMDKASILGDTIEYVKQLRRKIQELEAEEIGNSRSKKKTGNVGDGGEKATAAQVEVSIIERDALVEVECVHREGLLLDAMQVLGREFGMEITTVRSSVREGVFTAEMRAKVKENVKGRKASIMEVKKLIKQVILGYPYTSN